MNDPRTASPAGAPDSPTAAHLRPGSSPPRLVAPDGQHQHFDEIWELSGKLRHDPDIAALLQQAKRSRRRRHNLWQTGLAVAATVLLAWGALFLIPDPLAPPTTMALTAPVGEQRTAELPDSSRVVLNSGTRLVATFTESTRVVTLLEGEATFEVERDGRAFEVHTHGGVTRVLGTVFNVHLADNGTTRVSVLEGKVQVERARRRHGGEPVELAPGQAVDYDDQGLASVEPADTDRILSWHSGRLRFQEWPLTRVIEEYNRYTPDKVRVEGGEDILFSGSFTLENKEELISTLENVYGVRIQPLSPPS